MGGKHRFGRRRAQMSITLCVDFDNTIIGGNNKPLDGVKDALQRFKDKGWEIIISSARLDPVLWGEQLHFRVEDMVRIGRDLEKIVLARAVRHHVHHDLLVYENRTVVFD